MSIKDNFYQHINQQWLTNTNIPKRYNQWGIFEMLRDNNKNIIRNLIENCKLNSNNHIEHIIRILYNQSNDMNKRNKEGIKPILFILDKINELKYKKDIINIIAILHSYKIDCLFNINIEPDLKDSNLNHLYISHYNLGLTKDYYLNPEFNDIQIEYKKYIHKLLNKLTNKYKLVDNYEYFIFNFEKEIAKGCYNIEELRLIEKNYNKVSMNTFQTYFKHIDWKVYFNVLNIDTDAIIYDNLNFYLILDKYISYLTLSQWKSYLYFCVINSLSDCLSDYYRDLNFHFYHKILSGQEKPKYKWERNISIVNHLLTDAIATLFIPICFNEKKQQYIINMIHFFKKTLTQMIENNKWMTTNTKKKAVIKLNHIQYKIGIPKKNTLMNYHQLNLNSRYFIINVLNCNKYNFNQELLELNKKVNKDKWYMSPQEVNAYYDPSRNEIVFPCSILQEPYFSLSQTDEQNYAGIGSIIGHEITHAFDDQGRQYDEKGNLNNWWNSKDKEYFNKESDKLVKQYNQYQYNNIKINGKSTLGENIADLGGLKIALYSYISFYKKKHNKQPNQNQLQLFFKQWAEIWKSKATKEYSLQKIKNDVHSPEMFRVNGTLSNLDIFYQVYNIKSNDRMYINPTNRSNIW